MEFIYPFQPPGILHDIIDLSKIDDINKMCDKLLPDGTINYGIRIEHPIYDLQEQIYKMAYEYIRVFENNSHTTILSKGEKLTISRLWFLELHDRDYLQAHEHGQDNILSGIVYLKVPEGISKTKYDTEASAEEVRKDKFKGILVSDVNGCIEFTYNPMVIPSKLISSATFLVKPQVGHIYIWPGWLYHTIYPYYGIDSRRSLSFNVSINLQPVHSKDTVGRNDTCPCGSGKKYKRCCGGKLPVLTHPKNSKEEGKVV